MLLGAGYLGLFDPEWKKYSLESPYVDKYGQKVQRKSDETKIDPFYEKMNIKGLIYQFSIKEVRGGEETVIDKLCSIDVYFLNENNLLHNMDILSYLNNDYINLSKTQSQFHIKGEVTDKSDYDKRITKSTRIYSNWMPANIIFGINAENIFDKVDDNGFVIDKTTTKYPNQWKQLELCLKDMERKGRELNKYGRYLVDEQTLPNKNNDNSTLKNKIKNAVLSDKSFVKIDDRIYCHYNYDAQDFLNKYSNYYKEYNYKKYGKTFVMYQGSFIDIYNIDEKIYIRVFAEYDNGLPYIARYCEE